MSVCSNYISFIRSLTFFLPSHVQPFFFRPLGTPIGLTANMGKVNHLQKQSNDMGQGLNPLASALFYKSPTIKLPSWGQESG